MDLDLTQKHALVCGSSQGIGLATAQKLASMGCDVTLFARNAAVLQTLVEELSRSFPAVSIGALDADFQQPDAVAAKAAPMIRENPVHILVNNSGGPPGGPIHKAEPDAFRTGFEQHVIVNQLLSQLCLPGMQEARYGRILNIISTSVYEPIPGLGVSNTIRGAVASWAKTLSGEIAEHGITVNNVLPGFTETGRLDAIIANKAKVSGDSKKRGSGKNAGYGTCQTLWHRRRSRQHDRVSRLSSRWLCQRSKHCCRRWSTEKYLTSNNDSKNWRDINPANKMNSDSESVSKNRIQIGILQFPGA